MRPLLSLLLFLIISPGCNSDKQTAYGEKVSTSPVSAAASAKKRLLSQDQISVKLEATIETTCKMKGCWMTVKTDDGETMRVTFKDYGFFVPKEGADGKATVIEGVMKKTVTDVATRQHYAQDAGKSQHEVAAISSPAEEYTFVASGVIIEDL